MLALDSQVDSPVRVQYGSSVHNQHGCTLGCLKACPQDDSQAAPVLGYNMRSLVARVLQDPGAPK